MTTITLALFVGLCVAGAIASAMLSEQKNRWALALIASLASIVALVSSGYILFWGHLYHARLWEIPQLGMLRLDIDRISALFIFVSGLVFLATSVFSAEYMKRYSGRYSLKTFGIFYHLLFASIVITLMAGDVLLFLIAWEIMSILCYLLVNYEHEKEENTRAGLLMLAMSEGGTIAAAAALLLLTASSGHIGFASLKASTGGMGEGLRWAIFLLSFFGFGVKAGLVPTSTWLPRAHPAAPGNISALLSGVILNLGIYGIVRVNADLLPPTHAAPGLVVLIVGSLSAFTGILYATTENDLKKMLAHSSIENMGITTAGIGAGLVFMAYNQPSLAGIAFIVAFYHMANHSIYKSLLFLGAGAIDWQVGDRNMNRLGGLIKAMPWTAFFFLAGALSIAAMPPFNGFVSEWLTLQTFLQSVALSSTGVKVVFAICGAALALTAALAVTCFVKAFGMSFLGKARSRAAQKATEVSRSMAVPMAFLALLCLLLGILPTYVIPVLDHAVSSIVHVEVADELVPPFFTISKTGNTKFSEGFISDFHDLGAQVGRGQMPGRGLVVLHQGSERNPVVFAMSTFYMFIVLILLLGGAFVGVWVFTRRRRTSRRTVWDGGIRRLLPEMTYTATGFSNPVRVIFSGIFRPAAVEDRREMVAEHFRTAITGNRKETHIVDRLVYHPTIEGSRRLAALLSRMHSGRVNSYATYVLFTLILFLLIRALI